ncbi:MAG: DUF1304 domain-containing protein [Maritimibacter sp.]|jgi:putative membrane protein
MIATILALALAALQFYILVLEMFFWDTPRGRAAFGTTESFASETRVLAANQGLYNGFLSIGILVGLWMSPVLTIYMLACILVAGIYGGLTSSRKIIFVQAVPAAVTLLAFWMGI